jgi:tetratricopeptide (TPR) repeat protein
MIRHLLIALLGTCILSGTTPAVQATNEVEWAQPPFQSILETAEEGNKPIFIDFYTTWCGPCKKLDKVTYQDAKVIEYLNGIVAAKYDAEKGEGEVLARKYRIKAYPTLVLLGPHGEEIDRYVGYLGPEDFIEVIEGYQNGIGTVAYYQKRLQDNPEDTEALYELGMKYADAVRPEEAEATLTKLLEVEPDNEHKAEVYYQIGYAMAAGDRNEKALDYYQIVINDFSDSKFCDAALQMQARAYYALDERDKSVESYQVLLERHPDDVDVMNSFAWFCAQRKFGFDQALPVALKAAELSERDPGILDTLAELYYAMGDYDNAIKVGKEAADKEPDDQYLKDQLEKFRKVAREQASR